ncbi:hypothetical protein PSAC2689_180149 [Paraburkholderia sacchari]
MRTPAAAQRAAGDAHRMGRTTVCADAPLVQSSHFTGSAGFVPERGGALCGVTGRGIGALQQRASQACAAVRRVECGAAA